MSIFRQIFLLHVGYFQENRTAPIHCMFQRPRLVLPRHFQGKLNPFFAALSVPSKGSLLVRVGLCEFSSHSIPPKCERGNGTNNPQLDFPMCFWREINLRWKLNCQSSMWRIHSWETVQSIVFPPSGARDEWRWCIRRSLLQVKSHCPSPPPWREKITLIDVIIKC